MKKVFVPADDIADGKRYLADAERIQEHINELLREFKKQPNTELQDRIGRLEGIMLEAKSIGNVLIRRGLERKAETRR